MSSFSGLIPALGRAIEGQQVVWVAPTSRESRQDFESILNVVPDGATVRRTNGAEEIEIPGGGRLRFLAPRASRGFSCDRVYVPSSISDDHLMNIVPSLAASKDGAVIYY